MLSRQLSRNSSGPRSRPASKTSLSGLTSALDPELDNEITNLSNELKQVRMEIENERLRVKELTQTITNLKNDKFSQESNLITQLQRSQDTLRNQLTTATQSKIELLFSANIEMERLRNIIKMEHLDEEGKQQLQELFANPNSFSTSLETEKEDEKFNDNKKNKVFMVYKGSRISLDRKWPHCDISKIDFLELEPGDGQTYCSHFGSFNLKYTGYYVEKPNDIIQDVYNYNNWTKFTSQEVSNTVYTSRLGFRDNIIGLEQAISRMTEGCKALIWIPSRLAWGDIGAEPLIPPKSDIIFELDLVYVEPESETMMVDDEKWNEANMDESKIISNKININGISSINTNEIHGIMAMDADGSMTPLQQAKPGGDGKGGGRGMPEMNLQDSNISKSLAVPRNVNSNRTWDTPNGPDINNSNIPSTINIH